MRTDGVDISPDTVEEICNQIAQEHGKDYLPPSRRFYK